MFVEAPYCRSWTNFCPLPLLWPSKSFFNIFRKFSPETLVSCDLAVNLYFCFPTFLLITVFITNKYSPHRNTTQNWTPHLFFFHYIFRPFVLAIIRWTVVAGSTLSDLPGTLDRLYILFVSFSVTLSTLR